MDKRRSPRFLAEASAILRVQGRPGPFLVTIIDVSSSGVCLSSPTQFAPGTKVTIKCSGAEVAGEVRYARPIDGAGFHIGVMADGAAEGGDVDLVKVLGAAIGNRR